MTSSVSIYVFIPLLLKFKLFLGFSPKYFPSNVPSIKWKLLRPRMWTSMESTGYSSFALEMTNGETESRPSEGSLPTGQVVIKGKP